jgi:hypothetical protein
MTAFKQLNHGLGLCRVDAAQSRSRALCQDQRKGNKKKRTVPIRISHHRWFRNSAIACTDVCFRESESADLR